METTTPIPDDAFAGTILFLLRRLEKVEMVVKLLMEKGFLSTNEVQKLNLESLLRHGERTLRVNEKVGRDSTELETAVTTLRNELSRLRHTA